MMSAAEALSLKIQCDLSNDQYQIIRNNSLIHNADIYPTLHKIVEENKECYTKGLDITETQALCPLQNMLDHTLNRIFQLPESQEHLQIVKSAKEDSTGTLHCKIGFDGASSQSVYKQKYEETELTYAQFNEESLFQTAFVPLKLTLKDKTVWLNQKPSSQSCQRHRFFVGWSILIGQEILLSNQNASSNEKTG